MAKDINLNPLDDRIVVEPVAAEEKTAGGILLPDSAKEKPQVGEVVQVGPGKRNDKGVAPHTGAWIEMLRHRQPRRLSRRALLTRECGLKFGHLAGRNGQPPSHESYPCLEGICRSASSVPLHGHKKQKNIYVRRYDPSEYASQPQ